MAITQAITEAKEVTRKDGVQLKREYNRFVKAHNRFLHETFDNLTYSDKDSFLVRNGVKVDGKILELAGRINASYRILDESKITLLEYQERLLNEKSGDRNYWHESPDFPIQKNAPKTRADWSRLIWDTVERIMMPEKIGERRDALAARIEDSIVGRLRGIQEAIAPKILYVDGVGIPNKQQQIQYAIIELTAKNAARIVKIESQMKELKKMAELKEKMTHEHYGNDKPDSLHNLLCPLVNERNEILGIGNRKHKYYSGPQGVLEEGQMISYDEITQLKLKQE